MNGNQPQEFNQWNQPSQSGNQEPMSQFQQNFSSRGEGSVSKRGKWWIWFLVIVVVFLGVIGGLLFYIIGTPQYSLYKMYQAVLNKDYEEFSKYFNLDSVIGDLFEKTIEQQKKQYSSLYSKEQLAQVEAMIRAQFETYKKQVKDQVKKEIEEGNFTLVKKNEKASLIKLFKETEIKELPTGDVRVKTKNENGKEVTFLMRKKDGYWEIYKFDMTLEELMELTK